MNDSTLKGIFKDAAEEFGIEVLKAEFQPFKDLKVRWQRCAHEISFTVTDYLQEAPEEIVMELARTLLIKIYRDPEEMYSDVFTEWVTSNKFVRLNRDTYLQRSNALPEDFESKHHDLQKTYEGLVSSGIIEEIPGLALRWTKDRKTNPLGVSSALMRTVIMPIGMDSSDIAYDVFEFNLFQLLTNIGMDFKLQPLERKELADNMIASYPDSERLMDAIEKQRELATYGAI